MNEHEQLIKARCMDFCEMVVEKALEHSIPAQIVDSIFNLMEAKRTSNQANEDDLFVLHSGLVGFCSANDFLPHYEAYVVDYMASVMAIFEIAAIEIAIEEAQDDEGLLQ